MNIEFRQKYDNSEIIRNGVSYILESERFTSEYKNLIRFYLGWISDTSIPNSPVITQNIVSTASKIATNPKQRISVSESTLIDGDFKISTVIGDAVGYIERPSYLEDELIKAVDIEVDELIPSAPRIKIPTISKSKYDELLAQLLAAVAQITELTDDKINLQVDVDSLMALIESLRQTIDSEKLQTAVAGNEAQAANERYSSLLIDFQNALTKGIQEAIARVSLEAQVRGLQAQKIVLNRMLTQVQLQLASEQDRQASVEILTGRIGSYDQINDAGWKVPQSEIRNDNTPLFIKTYNDNKIEYIQGTALNLYNFSEEGPMIYTLKVTGDAVKWLEVPSTITIPARVGDKAGRGYVTLKWKNKRDDTSGKRNRTFTGDVVLTTSNGDVILVAAGYRREVDRKDTWGYRGELGTVIGQEIN